MPAPTSDYTHHRIDPSMPHHWPVDSSLADTRCLRELIRRRACELSELRERAGCGGDAFSDWVRAEAEILAAVSCGHRDCSCRRDAPPGRQLDRCGFVPPV